MKNLITWVEIPATDLERAVKFYNAVFSLELEIVDFGEEKMACLPNGEGAISQAPNFKPSRDGVVINFNVGEDMDGRIKRIQANKGTILTGKTKIEAEGMGYFALFTDSEGNRIGLYGDR